MKNVMIIGATSAIATEVAREFAKNGATLFLFARNQEKLENLANDLRVRGAKAVHTATFDAQEIETHQRKLQQAIEILGDLDSTLIAHGDLPDQKQCQESYELAEASLKTNFLSPVAILTWLANYFETRKKGNITVISSVAGDRGRQSNYIYGAAKGGLSTFLQGLRNRLKFAGVSVTTIKPGFVDTPMTSDLPKGPLFASASTVGKRIHKAMERGENVAYTPLFWRFIMGIIIHIPEAVFNRLRL
jgi:decaprenylphospho-beta-D-erythro-pentofuranosid-2-ulose 2-reductase